MTVYVLCVCFYLSSFFFFSTLSPFFSFFDTFLFILGLYALCIQLIIIKKEHNSKNKKNIAVISIKKNNNNRRTTNQKNKKNIRNICENPTEFIFFIFFSFSFRSYAYDCAVMPFIYFCFFFFVTLS